MNTTPDTHLGETQKTIMRAIWESGTHWTVPDMHAHMRERGGDPAYTTILTIMRGLHKRGFLSREEKGRGHVYTATCTQRQYLARVVNQLVVDWWGDTPTGWDEFNSFIHNVRQGVHA